MLSPSSFDIIYSEMLCMTHRENAQGFLYVAEFNFSQYNMNQIPINQ